jgi:hypothetical protein
VSRVPSPGRQGAGSQRSLKLRLDQFAWEAIQHESTRLSVSEEELIGFAAMYYLADLDSGRIARQSL